MRFNLELGPNKNVVIDYHRDHTRGAERLLVNGEPVLERSPWDLSTHISITRFRRAEFQAGDPPMLITFEKERPWIAAGLRPHTYRIFVNGELYFEKKGY